jgi:hypothetical protein
MTGIVTLAIIALVLYAIPRLLRLGIAATHGKEIGARALADQPDRIHLIRADDGAWKNRKEAAEFAEPLIGTGFEDAGIYTVDEMKGVVLRLFVRPTDAWLATVYEHPKVGRWVEVSMRLQGGGGFAVTSLPANGLDERPAGSRARRRRRCCRGCVPRSRRRCPSRSRSTVQRSGSKRLTPRVWRGGSSTESRSAR